MRLEFGSLGAADRETYKAAMTRQYVSNKSILESLGGGAKKDFCRGLNSAVIRYAADFVEAHPSLFESKDPPPQPERKSFQQEAESRLAGLSPLETLYVIKLAENKVIAHAKGLLTNPENADDDGQLWAMKVLAGDFALLSKIAEPHFEKIGKAYWERAQIYARYIRCESDHAAMARDEQANEDRKNDLYQARFDAYIPNAEDPSKARTAMLKDVGGQLSSMVIGHAKMMATDEK